MKVSDLKALLDSFSDDQEITVSIAASENDADPMMTYDIGCGINEFGELMLQVNHSSGHQKCSVGAPKVQHLGPCGWGFKSAADGPLAVELWKSFRFAPPFPQSNRLYYDYENTQCPNPLGVGFYCCTFWSPFAALFS